MQSSPTQSTAGQKRRFWAKMIWISAISLVLSVCIGIAPPAFAMINAFSALKTTGAADPQQLAGEISTALFGTLIAVPFSLIAFVLFVIAIIRHRKSSNPTEIC
jgi:ABC-type Fe3+ transport system permease subunit